MKKFRISAALLSLVLAWAPPAPAGGAWNDYRAIIWQPQKAASCPALKELGIDAAAVLPEDRDNLPQGLEQRIAPLRDCGFGWYAENLATDFYSAYHRYAPGKPVNWRFAVVKKAYRDNPLDPSAFVREPSLSDPAWQAKIRDRLSATVRAQRGARPLFYSLGDEPGIADLSAFWDFDFSAHSLAAMRIWLRERYGSLAALNGQWGSRFADWDAVVPMTTAEAMKRTDGNYSAWADFKEWMDVAFARALAMGTAAVHAADPGAVAGIEGGQIPGWGGYDYSRLARAVDVMELYDGGGNVEIVRSLNPDLVLLTTSAESGAREARQIWRALLRGGRGVIFWDPKGEIAGDRGRSLAPHLREIKSGLGARLIRSRRQVAPIAILYSPASMRMQWLLDWRPRGSAWSDRDASEVYEDANAARTSMTGFLDVLGRAGLEPRVVTPELLAQGALDRGVRVLILPRALALSESEAEAIRRFAAAGGTVIVDGTPGLFDEHGRKRARPALAGLRTRTGAGDLMGILVKAGIEPMLALRKKDGSRATDVEIHLWRDGAKTIVALQRDWSEAQAEAVVLKLHERASVYDLRARGLLATAQSLELTIGPVAPAVLELSKPAER